MVEGAFGSAGWQVNEEAEIPVDDADFGATPGFDVVTHRVGVGGQLDDVGERVVADLFACLDIGANQCAVGSFVKPVSRTSQLESIVDEADFDEFSVNGEVEPFEGVGVGFDVVSPRLGDVGEGAGAQVEVLGEFVECGAEAGAD